jgi:hypothetical protein
LPGCAPLAKPNVHDLYNPFSRAGAGRIFREGRLSLNLLISAFATALASVGLTAAALWAAGRFLGEKLLGHWLDGRLQRQREAHELKLEDIKSAQKQQFELLRADIGHLQDRGKHSNEREYAALTEIWEKFSDLYAAADTCIRNVLPIPDLDRMDGDALAKFLDRNNFTEDERAVVQSAADKNRGFSRVLKIRSIAQARSAYFDFRARFDAQNIFVPKSLADSLEETAQLCWRAVTQLDEEAKKDRSLDMKDDLDFLQKGPGMFQELSDAVRERLLIEPGATARIAGSAATPDAN